MRPTQKISNAVQQLEDAMRGVIAYQRQPFDAKISTLRSISYQQPAITAGVVDQIVDADVEDMESILVLAAEHADHARLLQVADKLRGMAISGLRDRIDRLERQAAPVQRVKVLCSRAAEQATKHVIDAAASGGMEANYTSMSLLNHMAANVNEARRVLAEIIAEHGNGDVAEAASAVADALSGLESAVLEHEGI